MVMDDPIHHARPEHIAGAAMVLVRKDEQVHIELRRALQDGACDIVLRCTYDLAVRIDACGRQSVDQGLDHLAVHRLDVVRGWALTVITSSPLSITTPYRHDLQDHRPARLATVNA
jgi:hypothetical protein